MHVFGIAVLDALLPVGTNGNWGGVQTGHVLKQPLDGVASHRAKLYGCIKRF